MGMVRLHLRGYLSTSSVQEAAVSFACDCLTEPIKSSLFYRRGLIELARLPSLARPILKITYFLFISWHYSRLPIHLHSSVLPFPPPPPCKVRRGHWSYV